ncbi:MAG TPA: beta-N-acetylhexosaminidase [Candidatus Sulfotelmatobacter sp.]|nr:beta-N-acetylhexosaminidase [Candidatus Sulfotelmatobacter sp.]
MKFVIIGIICTALAGMAAQAADELALIPQPQKMERLDGEFKLSPSTRILTDKSSELTAEFLAKRLRQSTGYRFKVAGAFITDPALVENILLTTNGADVTLGAEGYELDVATDHVIIRAPAQAGLFYGAQTLLQLLPPAVFSTNIVKGTDWSAPCVQIRDWPRFGWRGLMLDVSRHFYPKADVEKVLDDMALFKLNTFHWHLTDDQGWRIEIKKYPKLTQVGAWRNQSVLVPPDKKIAELEKNNAHPAWASVESAAFGADGRYGGFYTQRDVREIVAYAAARHITIVPEIEMPGHCVAALAAYPELGCADKPFSTDIYAGVNDGVFCAGNEQTFVFLDDVIAEVAGLFPGKYIHIGGDEVKPQVKQDTWGTCPLCQARMKTGGLKNFDELQGWFVRRVEKSVSAHGKTLIGWSEILQGGLAQNSAVMDWIGGAVEAASTGHDVVMASKLCYLDYYQSTNHIAEPHAIGGFVPLEKIYAFEPVPTNLPAAYESHILGGQCNLWTEYVASLPHAEYMIFPRACALAEVTWSAKSARNFDDFNRRLKTGNQRLSAAGINHHRLDGESAETVASKNQSGF